MELDLDLKEWNLICKVTFKCKSSGNSIFKIKGYAKTVDVGISRISIVISDHVNEVYVRPNKVFNKIKDISKKVKD